MPTGPAGRERSRAPILPRVARVRRRGSRPPYAPRAALGDLGSRADAHARGLGSAREHARTRRTGTSRSGGDARSPRPREVRRGRDRIAPREARLVRGVVGARLRRCEPDSRDTSRLGEGAARSDGPPHRDAAGWRARTPDLGRRPHEQRLRRLPPDARAEPRAEEALCRVLRLGRLARTPRSWTTSSR